MYEIVVEQSLHRYHSGNHFNNPPRVVASAPDRGLAIEIAEKLMEFDENNYKPFFNFPYEWDYISVWDTETDQVAWSGTISDKYDPCGHWVGKSDWLLSGAVKNGHCSQ